MFAPCEQVNLEESMNTLQFAARARHIASKQEVHTELVKVGGG